MFAKPGEAAPIPLPGVSVAEFESLLDYFYEPWALSLCVPLNLEYDVNEGTNHALQILVFKAPWIF